MSRSARAAATRRRALVRPVALTALSATVLVLAAVPAEGGAPLHGCLAVLVLLGAWRTLRGRVRTSSVSRVGERDLWRSWSRAFALMTFGAVAQLVLDVLLVLAPTARLPDELPGTVSGAAALAATFAVYPGLVRWNRFTGTTAAPGDRLNGISAVLAAVAVGNLLLWWTGHAMTSMPWWQVQGSLLRLGAAVVLVGTVLTVASLSGLWRDRRLWGVVAAIGVIAAGESVDLAAGVARAGVTWSLVAWVLAGAALVWCTLLSPAATTPNEASAQSTTLGSTGILMASVTVLVLIGGRAVRPSVASALTEDTANAATVFGLLAVLGVVARTGLLVRELSQLSRSRLEARTDDLTGTANRRELMRHLTRAARESGQVCLLVVDLDRFKEVNDRYGHGVGDLLLRSAAARLGARVPADALFARLGGDEFAVLLPGDEERGGVLAEQLVAEAARPVDVGGFRLAAPVSVGVAVAHGELADGELLRRADVAMFAAKSTGAGVSRYDEEVDLQVRQRAVRVEELRGALGPDAGAHGQFVVHYQPQVCMGTGSITGFEALVRWEHPVHGLLAPGAFLHLVEQHGLMPSLTTHVMWQATRQAARWQQPGRRIRVAVNVSTSFLIDDALTTLLDEVLASTGLDPSLLVVEVTETTLMVDAPGGLRAAQDIAARGVGLSIDDYGTGYSSLTYLQTLPAVELKLDQSFTSRVLEDPRTAAIVTATVELAHRLGLRLVAEGVEDEQTLVALRESGCDESQGYVHSRPLPADELEDWLTQHHR
ncbi:bifunctional diguanylate cyclase/phosphodiesterase [Actinotalea sp. K2]|uniref:putative bifunctional diguanylate cyclase/phosphodiesterase n=1 Tax=Actinotalea sp. K2 TaxID=2939438 RepID=UPI0020174BE0|nr:EAL domain-containing protein [Actinotalea sp. K2]MCL3862264.1 EAL domain-containing protein [Actinotalea sp. K2]